MSSRLDRGTLRAHLRSGKLIAYPTRGCFGLGCDPTHPLALKRLIRLKGRPQQKGLIVVGHRLEDFKKLICPLTPELEARAMSRWPGHWTWVMPSPKTTPPLLRGHHASLAVRVDNYPIVRRLTQILGPITSTSANRAREKALRSAREVKRRFGSSVLVIPGHCERGARPSTLADLLTGKIYRA